MVTRFSTVVGLLLPDFLLARRSAGKLIRKLKSAERIKDRKVAAIRIILQGKAAGNGRLRTASRVAVLSIWAIPVFSVCSAAGVEVSLAALCTGITADLTANASHSPR
jgi:hypothetical protein